MLLQVRVLCCADLQHPAPRPAAKPAPCRLLADPAPALPAVTMRPLLVTLALVALCRHQSPSVLVPALRTVGNIVTGDDMQTQIIINCGALPCLLNLLTTSHKKSIKKEACWTISNITAGTKEQIQVGGRSGGRVRESLPRCE